MDTESAHEFFDLINRAHHVADVVWFAVRRMPEGLLVDDSAIFLR